ncbi:Hypothetical_protein [Hexamita inflata]|uniref:Hypothetical_protein n=1 Tax=Hexamita inflata TaxID=28002 RepID=A0AA86P6W1_9EUKA|nr:Hypothetical protein HINF_LOCUS20300 [Hexamita inflata]
MELEVCLSKQTKSQVSISQNIDPNEYEQLQSQLQEVQIMLNSQKSVLNEKEAELQQKEETIATMNDMTFTIKEEFEQFIKSVDLDQRAQKSAVQLYTSQHQTDQQKIDQLILENSQLKFELESVKKQNKMYQTQDSIAVKQMKRQIHEIEFQLQQEHSKLVQNQLTLKKQNDLEDQIKLLMFKLNEETKKEQLIFERQKNAEYSVASHKQQIDSINATNQQLHQQINEYQYKLSQLESHLLETEQARDKAISDAKDVMLNQKTLLNKICYKDMEIKHLQDQISQRRQSVTVSNRLKSALNEGANMSPSMLDEERSSVTSTRRRRSTQKSQHIDNISVEHIRIEKLQDKPVINPEILFEENLVPRKSSTQSHLEPSQLEFPSEKNKSPSEQFETIKKEEEDSYEYYEEDVQESEITIVIEKLNQTIKNKNEQINVLKRINSELVQKMNTLQIEHDKIIEQNTFLSSLNTENNVLKSQISLINQIRIQKENRSRDIFETNLAQKAIEQIKNGQIQTPKVDKKEAFQGPEMNLSHRLLLIKKYQK